MVWLVALLLICKKYQLNSERRLMKIQKLTIIDGIIQDAFIGDIPVKVDIIKPWGRNNVRTLIAMDNPIGITVHNTGNPSPTAGDSEHRAYFNSLEIADDRYVGAHFFVDHDSITQILPINEVSFNAGDGKGDGNYKTVSIEICENKLPDTAESNGIILIASLVLTYPSFQLFPHKHWNGKLCPHRILERPNGWNDLSAIVSQIVYDNAGGIVDTKPPVVYRVGYEKAVLAGIEDGLNPNETMTVAKFCTYLDKIGELDKILHLQGKIYKG